MEDRQIIDLYWERSENAISETDAKYILKTPEQKTVVKQPKIN